MNVGDRYSLAWKHPHRIEATIIRVDDATVVANVDHRCEDGVCYLSVLMAALPIHGLISYKRREFEALFQPMCDAPALPPAENRLLSI